MTHLFEYASSHCLPDYFHDPEFESSCHRFDAIETALNALLDEDGQHLLTQLINEYGNQAALETYAYFEAAFGVCGELNAILKG